MTHESDETCQKCWLYAWKEVLVRCILQLYIAPTSFNEKKGRVFV
jgi:hypothetical protein